MKVTFTHPPTRSGHRGRAFTHSLTRPGHRGRAFTHPLARSGHRGRTFTHSLTRGGHFESNLHTLADASGRRGLAPSANPISLSHSQMSLHTALFKAVIEQGSARASRAGFRALAEHSNGPKTWRLPDPSRREDCGTRGASRHTRGGYAPQPHTQCQRFLVALSPSPSSWTCSPDATKGWPRKGFGWPEKRKPARHWDSRTGLKKRF